MNGRLTLALLAVLSCVTLCKPPDLRADAAPRPTFRAVRAVRPPVIDGSLDDPAWQSAPEITGFTQHDPDDGKPATESTVVKVVYDDNALYIGAFLHDSKPVTTLLGRRDNNLESDWFRINIDSQHDRLSGAAFWVNPSNVQLDLILYNDIYDDNTWDAVWDSAAKIVEGGWIAEVRIPFSQLRFTKAPSQTWGVNFVRRLARNKEIDRLVNTPKGETGFVSRFADLTGIDGVQPERSLEVVPYSVARSDLATRIDRANPFAHRSAYAVDGGVDVKYGLTSNLTLTGTINPDFGQVEVDPAVVNLSQFETFFPERRPFFTEGAQMFRFGSGPSNNRYNFNFFPPTFFYSRRIGRSPQGSVSADYLDQPGETTILGAAKVTGKFGKGWSIGVLDALTDRETAWYQLGGRVATQTVEPMTNYLVARSAKEYGKSSRIGVLFTSVNRRLTDGLEDALRQQAYTAGIDGYTQFANKAWMWEWLAGSTLVKGSEAAIAATQTSPTHRYQRPDANSFQYDPTRTSLSGFGGRVMLAKQTGRWRPNVQVQSYSPGFEINDVGFLPRADMIATHAAINYVNEDVTKHFRSRTWWLGKYQNWNYDHDLLANGLFGNWNVELKNYWYAFGWGGYEGPAIDDRRTRGGPVMTRASNRDVGAGFGSDSRKKFSFETSAEEWKAKDGSFSRSASLYLNYRPTTALRLSLSPSFNRSRDTTQFVSTSIDTDRPAGTPYVFSTIEQRTLDIGVRAEWTVNARLSLQLYLQPFVASGDYHDYKALARGRSSDFTPLALLQYNTDANLYRGQAASTPIVFGNPDFNFRSVKGNAVVRWQFRPGSALYVVWNENRSDVATVGDFRMGRDLSALPDARSRDVFLVKISYWLPM